MPVRNSGKFRPLSVVGIRKGRADETNMATEQFSTRVSMEVSN